MSAQTTLPTYLALQDLCPGNEKGSDYEHSNSPKEPQQIHQVPPIPTFVLPSQNNLVLNQPSQSSR